MAKAKAVALSVRPVQSADLCFPLGGIIDKQSNDLLGRNVEGFDQKAFITGLEPRSRLPSAADSPGIFSETTFTQPTTSSIVEKIEISTASGDGPASIDAELGRRALSRLRADDLAAELVQAVSWHSLKYRSDESEEAVSKKRQILGSSPGANDSLYRLLEKLNAEIGTRSEKLEELYNTLGPDAVTNPTSTSTATSKTTGGQQFETTTTTETTYLGRDYSFPWRENRISRLRSLVALKQERLAAWRLLQLHGGQGPLFERSLTGSEVRKTQVAYVDTFLLPPFSGLVTAVFRGVGDYVAPGQPVLRLEDDSAVYLVGTIKCRALLRIGDGVTVTTTLFGQPGAVDVEIEGMVRAVRGHNAIDEQWDVLIRCDNVANGNRILPLNYNFDFDATDIDIA